MRYSGEWSSKEDVCGDFRIDDFEGVVLFAEYNVDGYDGSANVLFMKGSQLYYVAGGHCSCYGLEDQWEPEEMSIDAIVHMAEHGNGFFGRNSWIADALRRIRDQNLAQEPEDVLAVLLLMA